MTSLPDQVVRGTPFRPGDSVRQGSMTMQVEAVTADGRPSALLCTFAGGLEAPDLVFAAWTEPGYQPFELPSMGETVELEAIHLRQLATACSESASSR